MNWKIISILILLSLVVVFTIQNYEAVKVKFLFWTFEASKAVVLFLTILIGIIIGRAISVAGRKKNRTTIQSVSVVDIFRDEKGKLLPSIKEIKRLNQTTIVRFQGVIDSSTIPIISRNIKSEMKIYLDKNILLDFKEAIHIDSSTLAYMITLLSQLKKRDRRLGLINTNSDMDNYLDVERVRSLVHVYKNEKEALKSLMRA